MHQLLMQKKWKHCINCLPLVNGRCCNIGPKISNESPFLSESSAVSHSLPMSFVEVKMMEAFGATLENSEGSPRTGRIEKIWERAALLRGRVYRLPGGNVGREFTSLIETEFDSLAKGTQTSERASMVGKLILQKDKKVKKYSNIKRLIMSRIKIRKDDLLEELIHEAEACDRKLSKGVTKMSEDEAILVFLGWFCKGRFEKLFVFLPIDLNLVAF